LPALIGVMSALFGLGASIGRFAIASYSIVLLAILALPETQGRALT
jgi:hypothetical protein